MKKIMVILYIFILAFSLMMSGCATTYVETGNDEIIVDTEPEADVTEVSMKTDETDGIDEIEVKYTDSDKKTDYNAENSVKIILDDRGSEVDGQGVTIKEQIVTINQAGTYVLSGILTDGQVVVDVAKDDDVTLVLDNVNITNTSGSAVYVKQAEKVFILLAEDSENFIQDGATYSDEEDDAPDAAIFSKDDLTIQGTGELTIVGNYKHAIQTKDELVITGGVLNITAVQDGLKGNDSVSILDGDVIIKCNSDGIISSNDEDEDKGFVSIDGGNIFIQTGENGIQGQTVVLVSDGILNIDSQGDAVHSNGIISVRGGTMTLSADDDGMHADKMLYIEEGTIRIENCYEGLESVDIIIDGGLIDINAKDDGINAADGNGGDANPHDHLNEVAGDQSIEINGGYIHIIADGDGMDSNGIITITNGTVVIDGAVTEAGDPAIDVNAQESFIYNGGILASVGCDSMFIVPTVDNQAVVTVMMGELIESGEYISLVDEYGTSIIAINPQHGYETMMFSSEDLEVGKSYSIMIGGNYDGETIDGMLYTGADLVGGTKLFDFVMDETLMVLDVNGNEADLSNYGNDGRGGNRGMRPENDQDFGQRNPEDLLLNLPITDGVLTMPNGTTYEVLEGETPTIDGNTIIFSNGVKINIFDLMDDMKEKRDAPLDR